MARNHTNSLASHMTVDHHDQGRLGGTDPDAGAMAARRWGAGEADESAKLAHGLPNAVLEGGAAQPGGAKADDLDPGRRIEIDVGGKWHGASWLQRSCRALAPPHR